MASSSGNKIICVGSNFYGQLGIGGKVRSHPPFIPTQFGCTKLADNSQPSSLVKSTLHSHIAKGSGEDDELDVNNISDIQCGATYSAILEKNGQVRMCGYMHGVQHSSPVSLNLPSALICIKIACGNKHMLMLLEGGYVLSLGCGYFGQLGHGDDNSVVSTPKLISVLDPSKRYLGKSSVSFCCVCVPPPSECKLSNCLGVLLLAAFARRQRRCGNEYRRRPVHLCVRGDQQQAPRGEQQLPEPCGQGSLALHVWSERLGSVRHHCASRYARRQ